MRLKGTNSFIVSLEGNDPAQTRKLLDMLLIQLQERTRQEKMTRSSTTTAVIRSGQIEKTQEELARTSMKRSKRRCENPTRSGREAGASSKSGS